MAIVKNQSLVCKSAHPDACFDKGIGLKTKKPFGEQTFHVAYWLAYKQYCWISFQLISVLYADSDVVVLFASTHLSQ